jgi:hypothetical protein
MWGNWCDSCGGVVLGNPPKLFFRHVAVVDGAGGRFPIVYDLSTETYGIAWPRKVVQVKCIHCAQLTPVEARKDLTNLDDIKPSGFYSKRGSLNEMIAAGQPLAQGDSSELPSLDPAPSATAEEVAIIRL